MPETEEKRTRRLQLEARTARVLRKIVDRAKRDRDLPPGIGMALFLFDFGGPGTGNLAYASTARREDMIAAVRELAQVRGGLMKIADQWRAYEQEIIPKQAGAIQREESRRAFYAGALTVFYGIQVALDPGSEPTEADLSLMENLQREFEEYAAGIVAMAPGKVKA